MQPQAPSSPEQKGGSQERLPKPIIPEADRSLEMDEKPAGEITERPGGDSANQNAGATVVVPDLPTTTPPTSDAGQPSTPQVNVGQTPPVAGDDDLIEKEWVRKAKEVVDYTREDPHVQSDAIEVVKTDYRKKRFGVDAPSEDESTEG